MKHYMKIYLITALSSALLIAFPWGLAHFGVLTKLLYNCLDMVFYRVFDRGFKRWISSGQHGVAVFKGLSYLRLINRRCDSCFTFDLQYDIIY